MGAWRASSTVLIFLHGDNRVLAHVGNQIQAGERRDTQRGNVVDRLNDQGAKTLDDGSVQVGLGLHPFFELGKV